MEINSVERIGVKTRITLRYKLIVGILTLFLSAGVVLCWAYSVLIGFLPITGDYENFRYHYSVTIPLGWRLGTVPMLFLNAPAFGSRPTNDAAVIVTRLNASEQWGIAKAINEDESAGVLPSYNTFISGNLALIQPEQGSFDPSIHAPSSTTIIGHAIQTTTGLRGWRYDIKYHGDFSTRFALVYFPYPPTLTSTVPPFEGVSIRTAEDDTFSEQDFSSLYDSFSFLSND